MDFSYSGILLETPLKVSAQSSIKNKSFDWQKAEISSMLKVIPYKCATNTSFVLNNNWFNQNFFTKYFISNKTSTYLSLTKLFRWVIEGAIVEMSISQGLMMRPWCWAISNIPLIFTADIIISDPNGNVLT